MLEVGSIAPDFTLPNEKGEMITLSSFRGKKVVVYFYPRDNTPGCTKQACAFGANYEAFKDKNIVVIGISKDSQASHKKFIDKYDLPFILVSDVEKEAIQSFGVWIEKKLYGKIGFGVQRATFLLDEQGVVTHVMPKVKPDTNATEILALL